MNQVLLNDNKNTEAESGTTEAPRARGSARGAPTGSCLMCGGGARGRCPVTAFFDFLAAFPSIGCVWLALALLLIAAPEDFVAFVDILYALKLGFDACS